MAIVFTISLLAACGGDSSNNPSDGSAQTDGGAPADAASDSTAASDSGDSEQTTTPPNTPAGESAFERRPVEVPDEILDLQDESIYYVIIDGKRFDLLSATAGDFLDVGFVFGEDSDYDENHMIDPNSYFGMDLDFGYDAGYGPRLYKEGAQDYFHLVPVNLSDKPIPLKDCEISHLSFGHSIGSSIDMSVVCNLSVGSTEERGLTRVR